MVSVRAESDPLCRLIASDRRLMSAFVVWRQFVAGRGRTTFIWVDILPEPRNT